MIMAMPEPSASAIKNKLRSEIWNYLEEHNLARFPRPVYDRIPNFAGAEKAAVRIRELKEFTEADVVKVNPDAPQAYVRQIVLEEGKTLLMPTPRILAGFLRLDSKRIPRQLIRKAISISGAFKIGQRVPVSKLPTVDLVVAGSVAVSLEGGRIGKGEGYSEIEYGVLRESGLIDGEVRVATTVHDCQLVDAFPVERHDLPADYVLTPTKLYETKTRIPRPKGIYWELVTPEMLRKIPVLAELRAKSQPK
jgi:5-formyltetrahydrofolate cyclo-ligase